MDQSGPFFSVIIPCLNEEKYLPKLLKDLQGQIDRNFEVIVVDGKSEDKTAVAASKFACRILKAEKRNVSFQRNLGAKNAQGGWLVFFDADVRIPANFLSEVHHYTLMNKNCRFLTTWMEPDSKESGDRAMTLLGSLIMEVANDWGKPMVGGLNMIIEKKSFINVGGYDQKYKMNEDHDLANRLAKFGRKMHILKWPRIVVSMRRFRREGTLSVLGKYAIGVLFMITNNPFTKELFDYEMGGKVTSTKKKSLEESLNKIKLVLSGSSLE